MAADAQVDVVAGGLQPFDVRRRHQELAVEFAHQETLGALDRLQRLALVGPVEQAGLALVAAPDEAGNLDGRDHHRVAAHVLRSEEHTSELQTLMRNQTAVLSLKTKK